MRETSNDQTDPTADGSPCSGCSRRAFIVASAAVLAGCSKNQSKKAAATTTAPTTQSSSGVAIPPASGDSIDVGAMTQYAKDGVYDDYAQDDVPFFIIRREGVIYALSASCTHKNSPVRWIKEQDVFYCPRHKSEFAIDGQVLRSPAKLPLPRFAVKVQNGHLLVDSGRALPPEA